MQGLHQDSFVLKQWCICSDLRFIRCFCVVLGKKGYKLTIAVNNTV